MSTATAIANPNIAFIKYWGDIDSDLRIPVNGSISMNLDGLYSRTSVSFNPEFDQDKLYLGGEHVTGIRLERLTKFLDHVRQISGLTAYARVESENNFPSGTGIASSASAFAALSLAASAAVGLQLDEPALSRLARRGSGSACRSVPGGFVEWQPGDNDSNSFSTSFAPPDHWALIDCIAIVSHEHKETGSQEGHALAGSSPLQDARVADTPRRLDLCREAILKQDFEAFTEIVELDSNLMHAIMMTSNPRLIYWQPATLAVIRAVKDLRQDGTPVCYTIDAGPNVHVLTPAEHAPVVIANLNHVPGVSEVLSARPGGPAHLVVE